MCHPIAYIIIIININATDNCFKYMRLLIASFTGNTINSATIKKSTNQSVTDIAALHP